MNTDRRHVGRLQGFLALVAVVFGVATVLSGGRVLTGSDPGYVVFQPLLIYNTTMGLAYLAAGVMMWRSVDRGKLAAGTIFALNLVVLAGIGYLYATGSAVAVDSLRAMTFRTVVWLGLFLGMLWLSRRSHTEGVGTDPG
jgi:hypothetical protein